jgi:putative transposase
MVDQITSHRYVKALQDTGIKQERTGYNNMLMIPDTKRRNGLVSEYSSFLEAKK